MTVASAAATNATQLLLNAFRPDQSPEQWEADRLRLGADWDDLAVRAIVFGLAPQVHDRFAQWEASPPPRAVAKLIASYQASAKRNTALYQQLGEALTAFRAHGLHPVALKGVHLAAAVYPDPALRPMNDIDLLFEPGELPKAEAILLELGYDGKYKSAELGAGVTKHTTTFRREAISAATPNPYLSPEADRMVEPHTSLEESWYGLRVDITPGVRQRAVEIELAGHRCHTLTPEDLLLHLSVHFCFHLIMGVPALVQLCDLLAVTRFHDTLTTRPLDYSIFGERAIDRQAAPYALAALTLTSKLLGAPVPLDVLDALAQATPESLRRRITSLGLVDVLKRTQQMPITTLMHRIRRGFADRAETAHWATDWRGRWNVWRTALNVLATDTGQLLLRKSLKSQIPSPQTPISNP